MYCMYVLYYSEAQDNRSIYGYIYIHVIHLFHRYRLQIYNQIHSVLSVLLFPLLFFELSVTLP